MGGGLYVWYALSIRRRPKGYNTTNTAWKGEETGGLGDDGDQTRLTELRTGGVGGMKN